MDKSFEKDPIETAHKLIRINETHDPFKLAKRLGYYVIFEDLGPINYAQRNTFCRITVITLNINIDKNWQRFVLAHEIGHAVLHQGFSTAFYRNNPGSSMINWAEKEANQFAMQIMLSNFDDDDLLMMNKYQIIDAMGLDDYNLTRYI